MWNLALVHLETVLVSVQDRCMVCSKRTVGLEIILDTSSFSVCLEIVLILTQDRCAICAKCTIDSEIILDAPNGTAR